MNDIFTYFDKRFYKIGNSIYNTADEVSMNGVANINPDQITSGGASEQMNQYVGAISVGKQGFNNNEAGYILGVDKGVPKFYIGNTTNYLNWTGTDLVISGNITATTGTIGGFTITSTQLTASSFILDSSDQRITLGSSNDVIILDANDATYRIWAGHATASSAPFSVTKAGVLTATGATITGTIQTATSGQRIVIASADNSLKFYDSGAQVIGIGTLAGTAMVLTGNSTTNNGIAMTSTVAGVGFSYTNNSGVNTVGLDLINTAGGGALPSIRITKTGTGTVMDVVTSTTGKGIYLLRDAGGGGATLLHIENTTTGGGAMVSFRNNGVSTGCGLEILHVVSASVVSTGILMDISSNNTALCYAFRFNGSEIVNAAVGGTQDQKIRISVAGTDYYIPAYTT